MTEGEWLVCEDPSTLLEFIRNRIGGRRCRLLAASFCRHVEALIPEKCGHQAISIAERYADGLASDQELDTISERVSDAYVLFPNPAPVNTDPPLEFKMESVALQATRFLTRTHPEFLEDCCRCTYLASLREAFLRAEPVEDGRLRSAQMRWQLALIHEVVGDPFRPVTFDPTWRTGDVLALARGIYDAKAFDRLPILADALQDAGCDSAELLDHCRGPGPHVRGCWALDLVLGQE